MSKLGAILLIGLTVGLSGPAQSADTDGDGVEDPFDNCLIHPNPLQLDPNLDGFGNRCDPDFNNDGSVPSQIRTRTPPAPSSSGRWASTCPDEPAVPLTGAVGRA